MSILIRSLSAEILKLRRTLALWLAVIGPLSIVGLEFLVTWQRGAAYFRQTENAWFKFGREMFFASSMMVLPLFIALQAALLAGLEHGNEQWKHLHALPLPRWGVYAAKQLVGMALIGLSIGLLVFGTVLAGLALHVLDPAFGFAAAIPWGRFFKFAAGVYLASWLMVSIHTWIGLRWKSFVLAMTVAVVATLLAMVVRADSAFSRVYPWAMPSVLSYAFRTGRVSWLPVVWGSLGGVAVAAWGSRAVTRRDVL